MMAFVRILSCDSRHHRDRLTRTVLVFCVLFTQPTQSNVLTLEAFTV